MHNFCTAFYKIKLFVINTLQQICDVFLEAKHAR